MNDENITAPSEHSGIAVVRDVLTQLNWDFQESNGDEEDEIVFLVDTDEDELLAVVKVRHFPGRVALYGRAHLTIDGPYLPAASAYISLVNNSLTAGCLCVRQPAPAEVTVRTSVNYTRVDVLEEGLVAGAISDMIDIAEASLAGLEAVAKGMDPDRAFDRYVGGWAAEEEE